MKFFLKYLIPRSLSPLGRRFIYDQIWTRRWKFAGLLVLSLISALLEMGGVGLVFPLLVVVAAPETVSKYPIVVETLARLGLGLGTPLSILLIILIGLILVLKNAYLLFFNRLQYNLLAKWKTEMSRRLMHAYMYSDYSVHLQKSSSEIIRNICLAPLVYDHFITGFLGFILNGVMLFSLCVLLVVVLPPNSIFGLIVIGVVVVVLHRTMKARFSDIGMDINTLYQRRQSIIKQSIGMIKETKLLAREKFFLETFVGIDSRNFNHLAHSNFLSCIQPLVIEGVIIVAVLGLVVYILFSSGDQSTGLAYLGLIAATLFRFTPYLNRILSALQLMNVSVNTVDIVAAELNELEPLAYEPTSEPAPLPFTRSLIFNKTTYVYPGASSPALKDITVEFPRNKVIGITGPSGSGKSTLACLLMGLLQPQKGEILVDGALLRDNESRRAWYKHIGYVPQSVFLIEDTVARNVAFSSAETDIDEERIWKALDVVQMKEYVESLPEGIHSFIGEDGNRLSGGQRQRLGIARAIYDDPEVLIFDEATSALDSALEQTFTESLMALRGTRTMFIIAHRLSTLRDCDVILMLDKGQALDMAPFHILESRCLKFQELVKFSSINLLNV